MTNVITIDVAGFKKTLDTMKGIISTKNSLPILGDVKLDYRKDRGDFTLTGSNGDARLTVVCVAIILTGIWGVQKTARPS